MIKNLFFVAACCLFARAVDAQSNYKVVSQQTMQQVYDEVKTPYKYGLVIATHDTLKKADCPTVFRYNNDWYMSYIVFNGKGYETLLAQSNDLLHWKTLGNLLSFSSDTSLWDANQKAGYTGLQDDQWNGSYQLLQYDNKYWMTYIGGKVKGYEAGNLSIGIAYTNGDPSKPHEWHRLPQPVLTKDDKDVRWWENRKLFKSTVVWDKLKTTGHPFVMYYNANGDTTGVKQTQWFERIGMAVSDDMIHWQRYQTEPVLMHGQGITGDPVIQKIGDLWVMFYFGAFWKDKDGAFNRFACSYDMVHWTDWKGDDLIKPSEDYDKRYAHKPFILKYNGVVYHFYCAVDDKDNRGIAVATSKDLGKSGVQF
ncbi:glycosylase [Ilyomonas limi]|uniref:Glycosylase n=1 Tax=Ilyomonas limi TaxID=2575867 RepID=A0A4U3KYR2_9BACT|nr:glycosylase [Ilyomonas limi]TKK67029.1 glycosylase [Ilyomonas limi]